MKSARISGLHLHLGRSVIIPMYPGDVEDFRADLSRVSGGWAAMNINSDTEYLGFVLGPTSGRKSWARPMAKMVDRASAWDQVGGGMQVSLLAARTFIISTARFVAQLLPPPEDWEVTDRKVMVRFFPGPQGWISPAVLRDLLCFGLAGGLDDLAQLFMAARARAYRCEGIREGGPGD